MCGTRFWSTFGEAGKLAVGSERNGLGLAVVEIAGGPVAVADKACLLCSNEAAASLAIQLRSDWRSHSGDIRVHTPLQVDLWTTLLGRQIQ